MVSVLFAPASLIFWGMICTRLSFVPGPWSFVLGLRTNDQGQLTKDVLLDADFLPHLEIRDADLGRERGGGLLERAPVDGRRIEGHGLAAVALDADRGIQRDLAQEREPEFGCGLASAAVPEDVLAMPALRAHVVAHV